MQLKMRAVLKKIIQKAKEDYKYCIDYAKDDSLVFRKDDEDNIDHALSELTKIVLEVVSEDKTLEDYPQHQFMAYCDGDTYRKIASGNYNLAKSEIRARVEGRG